MIYNSILEMIGNTKLLRLERISKKYNNEIYAKIEYTNPFGSIKDRIAYAMIKDAMENNLIQSDTTIIEPTSGNTGIALAAICLYFKLKCIIVMPESMSKERVDIIKSYKAEVVLTKKELGMSGAIKKANELSESIKSVILSQFDNRSNPEVHYKTTAVELYNDIEMDYFFCGIGTGGTISGCSKYLKEKNSKIKVIGIEPEESAVINKQSPGLHKIQGIGAGFIPKNLSLDYVDEVVMVNSDDAIKYMNIINDEEASYCGISSGACFSAVVSYIKKNKLKNKKIVMIFPDSLGKYISLGIIK